MPGFEEMKSNKNLNPESERRREENERLKEEREEREGIPSSQKQEKQEAWLRLSREDIERLKQKYLKGKEIPEETKKLMDEIFTQEIDKRQERYLIDWFEEHKASFGGEEGDLTKEAKIRIAISNGALEELENNPEEMRKRGIEEIYLLKKGLEEEPPQVDVQILSLAFFWQRLKETHRDYQEKQKNKERYSEAEIILARKRWIESSKVVKDLYKLVSGKDLQEKCEERFEQENGAQRQDFVSQEIERLKTSAEQKRKSRNFLIFNGELPEPNKPLSPEDKKKREELLEQTQKIRQEIDEADQRIGGLSKEQVAMILDIWGPDVFKGIKHVSSFKSWDHFWHPKIIIAGQEIEASKFDHFLKKKHEEWKKEQEEKIKEQAEKKWEDKRKPEIRRLMTNEVRHFLEGEGEGEEGEKIIREHYESLKARLFEDWKKEMEEKEKKESEEASQKESKKRNLPAGSRGKKEKVPENQEKMKALELVRRIIRSSKTGKRENPQKLVRDFKHLGLELKQEEVEKKLRTRRGRKELIATALSLLLSFL